ncbi:MAG: HIT family protein [Nanoarchaeota archaeon]
MSCQICQEISTGKKIYEDDYVVAFLARDTTIPGHIQVAPKKHHTIYEHLGDYEAGHLFCVVNKIASILVNYLKIPGINVLSNNGVDAGQAYPHFVANIIPRSENDGKDFTWQAKQIPAEEFSGIEKKVKSVLENSDKTGESAEDEMPKEYNKADDAPIGEGDVEEEKDYLIRSLDRIP